MYMGKRSMKKRKTIRASELCKITGRTTDSLRNMTALRQVPWVDEELPGGKQRRYGAVQLVSLVTFDMFRARGLSSDEAGFASSGLGYEIKRLIIDMRDTELDPDPVCGYLMQTIKSSHGYTGKKVDTLCEERQYAVSTMSRWFMEPVNAQPSDLEMWGERPIVIDAVAVMVSLREAYESATRKAQQYGYCLDGFEICKNQDLTPDEIDQ